MASDHQLYPVKPTNDSTGYCYVVAANRYINYDNSADSQNGIDLVAATRIPTTTALGVVKIWNTDTDGALGTTDYAISVSANGGMKVTVPAYSLPSATTSVLGGVYLGSDTTQSVSANTVTAAGSRTYAVQKMANTGGIVVNVPWTDTTLAQVTAATTKAITSVSVTTTGDNTNRSVTFGTGRFAPLGSDNKIDSSYLPSYVDDVIEGYYVSTPTATNGMFYADSELAGEGFTPEQGKIYVDLSTNDTYRWSGSVWVKISNPGTVTSVGLSAPTGFSVTGSPVVSSGTLTLAYASGYQGYKTTEATKLSGIDTGATKNTITLNGSTNANPSFYAPTTAGTANQALISSGTGAPTWVNAPGLSATGTITSVTGTGGSNGVTLSGSATSGDATVTLSVSADSSPTSGSSNFVTSSGLYYALASKQPSGKYIPYGVSYTVFSGNTAYILGSSGSDSNITFSSSAAYTTGVYKSLSIIYGATDGDITAIPHFVIGTGASRVAAIPKSTTNSTQIFFTTNINSATTGSFYLLSSADITSGDTAALTVTNNTVSGVTLTPAVKLGTAVTISW